MKKILTVVGARPQFIKSSPVSRAFNESCSLREVILHTGQHFDAAMSEVFFDEMSIPKPKYNLGIKSLSHSAMTGRMMEKIEEVLFEEKPDLLLVYGDTNSTIAGAMAAAKNDIQVAHVEAGLRSYNFQMPEEKNRLLTDRISKILFCPTELSIKNLIREGIENSPYGQKAYLVGDVMFDAFKYFKEKIDIPFCLNKNSISSDYVLATVHRAENTNNINNLKNIISAFKEIAEETQVVLPLHPRTEGIFKRHNIDTGDIKVLPPLPYMEMLALLLKSKMVITDSGGLQKESYFADKFCLTIRSETEWLELVEEQVNYIVGADKDLILSKYFALTKTGVLFPEKSSLYGDGDSALKIVDLIEKLL